MGVVRLSLFLVCVLVVVLLPLRSVASDLCDVIKRNSIVYGVPTYLIERVIRVESNYQLGYVTDGKGSFGLMQIQMGTAKVMGFRGTLKELLEPENNIKYGVKYLRFLLDRYNEDWRTALCAYNIGYGKVDLMKNPQKCPYVKKVLSPLLISRCFFQEST